MTQQKKIKVPRTNVKGIPEIGKGSSAERDQRLIQAFFQQLDPILSTLSGVIEEIQRRVAVLEEVKSMIPSKIEVVIKNDNLEERIKKLESPGK